MVVPGGVTFYTLSVATSVARSILLGICVVTILVTALSLGRRRRSGAACGSGPTFLPLAPICPFDLAPSNPSSSVHNPASLDERRPSYLCQMYSYKSALRAPRPTTFRDAPRVFRRTPSYTGASDPSVSSPNVLRLRLYQWSEPTA